MAFSIGHTKTAAYVIRNVEINGEHRPRRFSTWSPKAIATIRSLADTLEDRAIVVRLQRKPPGAKVERLRKRDNEWFAALRSNAARWAADNFDRLVDADEIQGDAAVDLACGPPIGHPQVSRMNGLHLSFGCSI